MRCYHFQNIDMKTLFAFLSLLLSIVSFAQDTLVISAKNDGIRDAWIWSWPAVVNANFGEYNSAAPDFHKVIRAESWQWTAGRNDTIRGLMQFDLGNLKADDILKAELNLWHYSNPRFTKQVGENALDIHLITESWSESGVTWNNQPTWMESSPASFPKSSSETQDYTELDVTDLLKAHQKQNAHGILLKLKNEVPFAGLSFASSEHPNEHLRPTLLLVVKAGSTNIHKPETHLKCFPNPAHTELTVSWNSPSWKTLELYNSQGQLVWQTQNQLHKTLQHINTSLLANGLYTLRCGGDDFHFDQKVLISH